MIRAFGRPARWLKLLAYGPHPVARYTAGSVDLATTRPLAVTSRVGHRFGEPSAPGWKYSGDLGRLQDFRGGAFVGKSRNLRRSGENRALPATSPAAGNPVMAQLAAIMPSSENDR